MKDFEFQFCVITHKFKSHAGTKTANITKDDVTSQHSDILAMCCEVISSFVIFAVLDLQVCGCRP